jgi:molybdopterin/thiamine biosynthesis adenylyltransferase
MDPDVVEVTNLNRQVLFYDAVGMSKAEVLAERLNSHFGARANALRSYFREDTDVAAYEAVFDCVDNFETRIVLSEKCKTAGKVLISGGTGAESGQMVPYVPGTSPRTPAEALGLHDIVDARKVEEYRRERASCVGQPAPSVIMTNQIIAGFMVNAYRLILDGREVSSVFYDSRYPWMLKTA